MPAPVKAAQAAGSAQSCRATLVLRVKAASITGKSRPSELDYRPNPDLAIADRLSQPEGAWLRFGPTGGRSLIFPDPARSAGRIDLQDGERQLP